MTKAKIKRLLIAFAVPFGLLVAVLLLIRAATNAKANGVSYWYGVRKEIEYLLQT